MPDLHLPTGALADRIELTGLTARGRHGVFDHEKAEGQDFTVDIVLHTTTARAAASDDLSDTISYADVADEAVRLITGEPVDLIETLAERIAESALATGALAVDVTVHKPSAPIPHTFGDVSVSIRRLGVLLATPKPAAEVVVGIGSNLGDPVTQVEIGAAKLARILEYEQMSRTRVTPAEVAPSQPTQPNYINAVMIGRTRLSPLGLLAELQRIEDEQGRTREEHWGPRTLDLDLISYKIADREITSDDPDLTLPHPRAHLRNFVMEPWAEVDPWGHLRGKPIR
ncbi:2-amino-4-hydroxy-6-hydroxymethyldihydropteridine diphosphokinase [Flaviflexus salsibiostraticola]|uniref:Bifunctional folate synthesis protein n=1 Tax=Flaviflexus salsibiostraticola TaxID=1282737 RepID=A0A3Q8WTX4_9ACTO|nr:2-amino-4-hydroxy-6-hydroxymethyldihydropteridine diphosphokinase [Flaviflexus salsibiostraticola]AZN30033.1 2-amino-4-hydroxy-6-hydroxymethyldihydropteridine diphosphokinase [Flaviflexus salsibiostraticola]